MLRLFHRVSIQYVIVAAIVLVSLIFTVFVYNISALRLWEALQDVWTSVVYYFQTLFGHASKEDVTFLRFSDLDLEKVVPFTWDEFVVKCRLCFFRLFDIKNFIKYMIVCVKGARVFSVVLLLLMPILVCLWSLFKLSLVNKCDEEKTSRPLMLYLKLEDAVKPCFLRLVDFYRFFQKSVFFKVFVLVWLVNLNVVTVVVEAFAFYFFFAASLSFEGVYVFFAKTMIDMAVALLSGPLLLWGILFCCLINVFRRWLAVKRQKHMEMKNRGFIKSLPQCVMVCAEMGMGKTTLIVDMALSNECINRDMAWKGMFRIDCMFPDYPWYQLEKIVCGFIQDGAVNLSMLRERLKDAEGDLIKCSSLTVYDNGLIDVDLFGAVTVYAQLYMIYITESAVISNFSIRIDAVKDDGFFPFYDENFFAEKKKNFCRSHILDFDTLRLGKKVLENNLLAGSLEFGTVAISEVGKERGNKFDMEEIRKGDTKTNQKNDLFNLDMKMRRHAATVDNTCYFRMFVDEQRPESLGADARELCYIMTIVEKSDIKLAMPFFCFAEVVNLFLRSSFHKNYYDFRHNRIDRTLFMHLYKKVCTAFLRHYDRIYNLYGYHTVKLQTERGNGCGEMDEHLYFLIYKKIYPDRFATDCFSDFYAQQALVSGKGLMDYPRYKGSCADVDELRLQNSYFVNAVLENAFQQKREKEDFADASPASNEFQTDVSVPDGFVNPHLASSRKKRKG